MSVVANVAINVDSRGATQKLREVQIGAKATEQAFNALTSAAAAFGAGFAISRVIQDVKELDTNLRRLGTVGGDVTALDKGLGQLSKNLDGVASKAELAAASYQALSAGFSETGANLKLVEAATKAAVGGLADTTQVTEVLTKTLNAYGLSGDQAIKVTDSISKAIEYGQVEWADYTSQLGRVASIAAIAGVSIDEVNAFVAAATKNGATAEIAFTGLGATLNSLLQPTKESQEAAAALGIQWNVAGLNAKGFDGLIAELAQKMGTNKEEAVRLLGSQEALRGAFAAASKNGKDFSAALTSIQDATGKTDMDFQKMRGSVENTLKALDTAFANLSEALFKAFGPTLVIVIQDIAKNINAFAAVMSSVPQPVMDVFGAVLKLIAQMLLLQKAISAIIALRAGMIATMAGMATATAATGTAATTSASAFALYTNNTKALAGAAATATPRLVALRGILGSIAKIGTIMVAVNIAVYGVQELINARAELNRLRGIRQAGGAAAAFGGTATAEQKAIQRQVLQQIAREREANLPMEAIGQISGFGRAFGGTRAAILAERERSAKAILALPTRQTAQVGDRVGGDMTGGANIDNGGGGGAKQSAADDAAKEEARLQSRIRGIQLETAATKQLAFIRGKIAEAQIAGDQQLAIRLQGEERNQQILVEYQKTLEGVTDQREQQALQEEALAKLQAAGIDTAAELEKLERDRRKTIEDIYEGLISEEIAISAVTDAEKDALRLYEIENQLKKQGIALTEADREAIRLKIAEIQKLKQEQQSANNRAAELNEIYEGIAGQIAGGVGNAIDAIANGVDNLGDALANIGKDIMAAVGKMLIFYALAQAFGALGGNDDKGVFSFLAKGFGFKGAKDGAYWPGGFQAFADGGVVTSPTMGLIGEGGEPEYVIPASKMRSAMGRYASGARGASVIPGSSESGPAAAGGTATLVPIDVRYTVERINSVDYVTADQFQAGMAQAAEQGARRGEQRALTNIRQNTTTRRRLGL